MNYKRENAETKNKRMNLISRLEGLRQKMKSLGETMQRERTLIDYHMQTAASHHTVSDSDYPELR